MPEGGGGGQCCNARTDCPPSPIIAAYIRINTREDDREFVPSRSPTSSFMLQSIRTTLDRAAESTPPLLKSVSSAIIAKASSLAKSEKTKNSSNKSKERTSIASTRGWARRVGRHGNCHEYDDVMANGCDEQINGTA